MILDTLQRYVVLPNDIQSRADEIEIELMYLDLILGENPLNKSAKYRYVYLSTILTELTKYIRNNS